MSAWANDYDGHYEPYYEEPWWDGDDWYDYGTGDHAESDGAGGYCDWLEFDANSMVFYLDDDLEPKSFYVGIEVDEKSMVFPLEAEDIDEQLPAQESYLRFHPEPPLRPEEKVKKDVVASPKASLALSPNLSQNTTTLISSGPGHSETAVAPLQFTPQKRPKSDEDEQQGTAGPLPSPNSVANQPLGSNASTSKLVLGSSQLELLQRRMLELKNRRKLAFSAFAPSATATAPATAAVKGTSPVAPLGATTTASNHKSGRRSSAASHSSRLTCPGGHLLKLFPTPETGWWCSVCRSSHAQGSIFYSCRACDYDKCETCAVAGKSPAAAAKFWAVHESGDASPRCSAASPQRPEGSRSRDGSFAGKRSISGSPSPVPQENEPPRSMQRRRSSRGCETQRGSRRGEERESRHSDEYGREASRAEAGGRSRGEPPAGSPTSRHSCESSAQQSMATAAAAAAEERLRSSRTHGARAGKKRRAQLVPAGSEEPDGLQDPDCAEECMPGDSHREVSVVTSDAQESSAEEPDGEEDDEEEEEEVPPAREVRRSKREPRRCPRERRKRSSVVHHALARKAGRRRREGSGRSISSRAPGASVANAASVPAASVPAHSRNDTLMAVREWRGRTPSNEPARKRGRAANALAISTAMEKTPPQRKSSVGSRAVSLTRSPGTTQPLPVRGSVGVAGVEAPRSRGGSNDDFLRRVLRASGQQVKKGGLSGSVVTGIGDFTSQVDRKSRRV